MDVLSQLLAELRVESTISCRFAVAPGRGVAYRPTGASAAFHLVTSGRCWLVLNGERVELVAGDFAVLPRGDAHQLQAGTVARVEPVEVAAAGERDGVARVGSVGSAPPAFEYLCGALRFGAWQDGHEHPLLTALPRAIRVGASRGAPPPGGTGSHPLPWLAEHVAAAACESRSGRPGAETVLARLSEVLFVQAVRWQLAEPPNGARGWLGALRDARLARAIGLMHRHPDRAWTVASLARDVGLSRSQFADRFSAVVGRPPLGYLADWRMHLGRSLLRDGALRVGEVARRVGYGSEAAFSAAFKRATGVPPRAYRRAAGRAVA